MLQVIVVGLSHKTAPVETRERFAFSQTSLEKGLVELFTKRHVEECLILSTCNRVEIYAVSEKVDDCVESIKGFLSEYHNVPIESFSENVYVSIGHVAVRHLFNVTSSIDSMVIGEPQILGQVKQAYKTATMKDTVGLILNRLFHTAFFVAKRVREETNIGSQAVSVSYVAVELAKRIFEDLHNRSVMLIGTGDMAELAAKHLISAGIEELFVASRNIENSRLLAERLHGRPIGVDEVYYCLKDVDIVISATGSSEFIIRPHHVREALKLRKNEPIFMIDIAVPRDIDPRVEEISNVYLYDIDDLRGVLDDNMKSRRESAKKAEEIVLHVEENFQRWLNGLKVIPTIIKLKKRFEEIKETEVNKALYKIGNYTDREKNIIEGMASVIVGKILHNPLTNLKKESSTSLGALYMDSLLQLFDLDNDLINFDEEDDEASVKDRE